MNISKKEKVRSMIRGKSEREIMNSQADKEGLSGERACGEKRKERDEAK